MLHSACKLPMAIALAAKDAEMVPGTELMKKERKRAKLNKSACAHHDRATVVIHKLPHSVPVQGWQ